MVATNAAICKDRQYSLIVVMRFKVSKNLRPIEQWYHKSEGVVMMASMATKSKLPIQWTAPQEKASTDRCSAKVRERAIASAVRHTFQRRNKPKDDGAIRKRSVESAV